MKENYTFLNGSLAFSSGCLIFTSLYRLLPEALKYLQELANEDNKEGREGPEHESQSNARRLQFLLMVSYFGGIIICAFFNYVLHLMTSESVVHCNHGNDVKGGGPAAHHSHSHHHADNHDVEDSGYIQQQEYQHQHDHEHHHYHDIEVPEQNPANKLQLQQLTIQIEMRDHENTPLLRKTLVPRKSLLRLFLPSESEEDGECKGFSSAERCYFKNDTCHDPHESLHYCELPELPSEPHSDGSNVNDVSALDGNQHHYEHEHEHEHQHQHQHENEHEHEHQFEHNQQQSQTRHSIHLHHEPDHHHHVNSPLSRLLLIGIQTTLAITLHKLPEGFITYITSETNPTLGVSIFISLTLHNFTEGFSMCLPLYFSMAETSKFAKVKAVSLSAILGGLSQPLGAILGYFFLKVNEDKYSLSRLNLIFGITMAITSGFLTVVALSMYGSAVSFGGNANHVMTWCIIGIILIGSSSILSAQ